MKKLLLSAVLVTAALASQAQVAIGVRAGANFAKVRATSGDADFRKILNDNTKNTTGLLAGAVFNFGMGDVLSVQPEVLFSQQGAKFEGEDADEGSLKLTNNYLQVPVLLKATFGGDNVKFFANAGPYASYWLSGKYKSDPADPDFDGDYEFDDSFTDADDVDIATKDNRLDIGAAVGVGIGFAAGPGMLQLEARYNHGFSDMTKYKDDRPSDNPKLSNRFIGLSLAYLFNLGQ